MNQIASENAESTFGLHQITGGAALVLMGFHLIWAIAVYKKGSEKAKKQFHKFSLGVWSLWVISFILGMFVGMGII